MGENRRTTYSISETARALGISIEWLRAGERRGFFPETSAAKLGPTQVTIRAAL